MIWLVKRNISLSSTNHLKTMDQQLINPNPDIAYSSVAYISIAVQYCRRHLMEHCTMHWSCSLIMMNMGTVDYF